MRPVRTREGWAAYHETQNCGHLDGGEDLVIRWYARATMALVAVATLVVGVGAGWRWR
jgi:hypothetical protein